MAFNPQHEDYQRLWLRYARTLEGEAAANPTREFARFGNKFACNRDELPQTDADRAFHLVSEATLLIDYQAPFANETTYPNLEKRTKKLLDEALTLDAKCFDALRMRAVLDMRSFEAYYDFLAEHATEVRASYEQNRDELRRNSAASVAPDADRTQLELDLIQRPYLRWLSAWAEQALICGRNRQAIRIAEEAFRADKRDTADVRFTAALALAKLEDAEGLAELATHQHIPGCTRSPDDAWMQIAQLSLAFKRGDLGQAEILLQRLLDSYLHAAETLIRQTEIPDGLFSRFAAIPYSEDELIVATSEATVLLQEGRDENGQGSLSFWVMDTCAKLDHRAALNVFEQSLRQSAGSGNTPGSQGAGGSQQPQKGGLS